MRRQPHQSVGQLRPQFLGLEKLPLIVFPAVLQAETSHEIISVQLDRLFQEGRQSGQDMVGGWL